MKRKKKKEHKKQSEHVVNSSFCIRDNKPTFVDKKNKFGGSY